MIGCYLPVHNNPVFYRAALLQVLAQTVHPHVLAVFENGHGPSFHDLVADVVAQLERHGVLVLHRHEPKPVATPLWQAVPIRMLLERGVDTFVKLDQDDIYFADHVETVVGALRTSGADWVANRRGDLIVTPRGAPYARWRSFEFAKVNGTGSMVSSGAFSRSFAEVYVVDLEAPQNRGLFDDMVMHRVTFPKFPRRALLESQTAAYVSHGANASTPHWVKEHEERRR